MYGVAVCRHAGRVDPILEDRAGSRRSVAADPGGPGAHSPSANAFGKLPESDETGQDYRERVDATLENLGFAVGQQEQIAEFIERTARSYHEVEDHTSDQIRTIAAQARGTM
jgi:hypothetical protein